MWPPQLFYLEFQVVSGRIGGELFENYKEKNYGEVYPR